MTATHLFAIAGAALAAAVACAGLLFIAAGALGLARFPDVFARAHAVAGPVAVGATLATAGLCLAAPSPSLAAKLLLLSAVAAVSSSLCVRVILNAADAAGLAPRTRASNSSGGAP